MPSVKKIKNKEYFSPTYTSVSNYEMIEDFLKLDWLSWEEILTKDLNQFSFIIWITGDEKAALDYMMAYWYEGQKN